MSSTTPPPPHRRLSYLQSFCTMRAERVAREVHAFSRIPLRERQLTSLDERMLDAALLATSDDDVTARVDAVQDAFAGEIRYRTPRMWKHCRMVATIAVMRKSLLAAQPVRRTLEWRARKVRALCQRLFAGVMGAPDDEEIERRLQEALRGVGA